MGFFSKKTPEQRAKDKEREIAKEKARAEKERVRNLVFTCTCAYACAVGVCDLHNLILPLSPTSPPLLSADAPP